MDPMIWAILLLLLGVGLIILDVFVPSHGLLSVLAAAAVIAGIVVAFSQGLLQGTITLAIAALVIPAVIVGAVRYWPPTPMGKRILIQPPVSDDDAPPGAEEGDSLNALVGRHGKAKTKMLPSG